MIIVELRPCHLDTGNTSMRLLWDCAP